MTEQKTQMAEQSMAAQRRSSYLGGNNLAYVEQLYESYLDDPVSIPGQWREQFEKLPRTAGVIGADIPHGVIQEHFRMLGQRRYQAPVALVGTLANEHTKKQMRVLDLISAYRHSGHQKANLDPLGLMQRDPAPMLDLAYHHLSLADLDTTFGIGGVIRGQDEASLQDVIQIMENVYCGTIGAEYMHISDATEQAWIQQRLEALLPSECYDNEMKTRILERLIAAEGLEKYLHNRYPGTKRFGLEGGESLIPMLHELLHRIGSLGCVEAVIGMAHRGRLNVLVNILGKHPQDLFEEFEGKTVVSGSGDVKYHQGFSSNVMTPGGEMHLALGFNPSHLEICSGVIEGSVRARQDRRQDTDCIQVVPVLVHGDAAFAGQGVVMETFQMSQTRGFKTGGTLHIIVNNQIGFTTHEREDVRSAEYCTEVAKMVQAPIFHVNADDPQAVLFVTQIAADYRMEFKKDVVVDMVCYRRRGHNEAEEPSKTQPIMYRAITNHPTTCALYAEHLAAEGIVSADQTQRMTTEYRDRLDQGQNVALSLVSEPNKALFVDWTPYLGHEWTASADTRVSPETFLDVAKRLDDLPPGFVLHRQVAKIMEDRRNMAVGAMPVNWGFAEVMAYATLINENRPIRLTGQDCGVGTFSHRHVCLHSQTDGERFIPVAKIGEGKTTFDIYDSLLSEEAVLAFEYGYTTTRPDVLAIWEAQFGDFANGAQVVIDQFISSGEEKWARLCGLVLLLPHGFEGAGPEHSSGRLERYLQLCAEHNMQVCIPTTPAQIFHMLRRQSIRPLRKPLVVMTPKSLLRHRLAVSTVEELCEGSFQPVIDEVDKPGLRKVKRVVMCSGKVYYDLLKQRQEDKADHIAIIRLEQLYPFPEQELTKVLAPYKNLYDIIWCQEEPMNQGVWYCTQHRIRRVAAKHDGSLYLKYAGRDASAAPATGHMSLHLQQQKKLVQDALYG